MSQITKGKNSILSKGLRTFRKSAISTKGDSNKIYSLHEQEVSCIAKGKLGIPYEFGNKASIATTQNGNIIVAAVSFQGNPHDSKTLDKTLAQHQRVTGIEAKSANVDRGYA